MNLEIQGLGVCRGKRTILSGLDLTVEQGMVTCLLGPNGVGKTTLFRALLGLQNPRTGQILVDGLPLSDRSARDRARLVAWVPQAHQAPFPFTVEEVVLMGATPRVGLFSVPSARERDSARNALEILAIDHLAGRIYTELSGGEQQLVLVARALAQEPAFLILDEPTSNLDFGKQILVLDHVNRLAAAGKGILMTTHFPHHVFLCPGRTVLMGNGGRTLSGPTAEVVTESTLEDIFGIPVCMGSLDLPDGSVLKSCMPLPGQARTPCRNASMHNEKTEPVLAGSCGKP